MSKSVDTAVQHTNDDSVVSKRSAGRHGYVDDDYLRHFVKKTARRSPLINRGYYLRIFAMTDIVERSLCHFRSLFQQQQQQQTHQRFQVLSLGAGYDTLAARLYKRAEFSNVHFFDVDFPEVIRAKTQLMQRAPLSTQFPFVDAKVISNDSEVRAYRYSAVGLDLRKITTELLPLLQEQTGFDPNAPTVVYAECVMQYMPVEASTSVVAWVAKELPCALFYAYDQIEPLDSFGKMMRHSLKTKCSPLLGIAQFSNGQDLVDRAARCGMQDIHFANFYDVAKFYISGAEKQRVEALEVFDEWEEWYEMCGHYGILGASTSASLPMLDASARSSREDGAQDTAGLVLFRTAEEVRLIQEGRRTTLSTSALLQDQVQLREWPTGRCSLEGWGFGDVIAERVSTASPSSSRDDAEAAGSDMYFLCFGGLLTSKGHARSDQLLAHSLQHGEIPVVVKSNESDATAAAGGAPSLVFHSFTRLSQGHYLILFGRTNPGAALNDAWLCVVDDAFFPESLSVRFVKLSTIEDRSAGVPSARYRHTAVALDSSRVFVYGGRSACGKLPTDGQALQDGWIATVDAIAETVKWTRVSSCGDVLPPLYSTTTTLLGDGRVVLCGGATSDETCTASMWLLSFPREATTSNSAVVAVSVRLLSTTLQYPRFSHSVCTFREHDSNLVGSAGSFVAVHGGTTMAPRPDHDLNTLLVFRWNVEKEQLEPLVEVPILPAAPVLTEDSKAVLGECSWTRHALIPLRVQSATAGTLLPAVTFALVGGGFTCFSFGTFSCKPILVQLNHNNNHKEIDVSSPTGEIRDVQGTTSPSSISRSDLSRLARPVPVVEYDASSFAEAAKSMRGPLVFRRTPLGACRDRWSPEYLTEASGDVTVSVHVGKQRTKQLDFVNKNFTFRHVALKELIAHCFSTRTSDSSPADAPPPTTTAAAIPKPQQEEGEVWYFRSVGANMKSDRSDFWKDFPNLAADVKLPAAVEEWIGPHLHQSCFRINDFGMQLWTHYDTLDNILCQVLGTKRVVLFPPSAYNDLYMKGSSSRVTNIDHPDLHRFPRFYDALKVAQVVELQPGDMLLIPPMWFHHITAVTACVGLNIFFERPTVRKALYDPKDLYGNKDLPVCSEVRQRLLAEIEKELLVKLPREQKVPQEYVDFTLRQLIQDLEELASGRRNL